MPALRSVHSGVSRRSVLAAASLLLGGGMLPALAAPPIAEGAEGLVRSFAQEGVSLLEDKAASPYERTERFRSLLEKYFATDAIARWVLGRYWSRFSAPEQAEYRRLFEDLVVYGYVKRFGEYTGERLRITRTIADSETQATVFSEINRPAGGQPIRVDWRIGSQDRSYRITDVVVENVSLSQTWRSDFAGTIQQGGSPASLLETLRTRTAQLKADLGVQ